MLTCTICGNRFEPEISTTTPFCSQRCRNIDFGRWMNEEYGMPVEEGESPHELPSGDEPS
ncbi:MAG: DNA gyrase inhibitor YacG [Pirellulales bacterium]|nr:DNA gyrase inhibitor YacG [Pirellulales bacterium]